MGTYIVTDGKNEEYAQRRIGAKGEVERLGSLIAAISAAAKLELPTLSGMHEIRYKDRILPEPLLDEATKLRRLIKSGKKPSLKPKLAEMYDYYVSYRPTPDSPCLLERILDDIESVCKHAQKHGLKVYME